VTTFLKEMLGAGVNLFAPAPPVPRRVAILGAGPAGLLAAEAAEHAGFAPDIYSKASARGMALKSELHGCQYLHAPRPGSVAPGTPVAYTLRGDSETYRQKVYGDQWNGTVSPDEFGPEENHLAWDLRFAYDRLWDKWGHQVIPRDLNPRTFYEIYKSRDYRHIISTIPAPALCIDQEHRFRSTEVWALGETTTRSQTSPVVVPPFTVVCNGEAGQGWYRAANVFGYTTVEWPARRRPPVAGVVRVQKPLDTDCGCWIAGHPGMLRVGRYGTWRKGVLVHEAYTATLQALSTN
jgi:hypothetical protein